MRMNLKTSVTWIQITKKQKDAKLGTKIFGIIYTTCKNTVNCIHLWIEFCLLLQCYTRHERRIFFRIRQA